MKILFAGTPGVRKSLALETLRRTARVLFPDERIFVLKQPNQQLPPAIPLLEHLLYKRNPIPFLKQSQRSQKDQWREAFDRIRDHFERAQTEHHFLGLHFTYRYQQIPACVVDFKRLIDWKPDCMITFIDDAYCVRPLLSRN